VQQHRVPGLEAQGGEDLGVQADQSAARGWRLAHWLVAHAQELDVAVVIFDRQIWSARRSPQGWRPYAHPSGDTDNPVLAHEDHVHVDVGR
jgi:hypothetical protein